MSAANSQHHRSKMIQDTSLWAYARATQNLGKKQKEVLDALRFFPDATNAELAARLNWPVNRITPRVLEIRKMGLILDAGKRTCKVTGSTAHARGSVVRDSEVSCLKLV